MALCISGDFSLAIVGISVCIFGHFYFAENTAKGGVNKTVKHFRFRDHSNAVERECVHLRESGCKFTAGIWVLIDME